jgi:hypothetical protein
MLQLYIPMAYLLGCPESSTVGCVLDFGTGDPNVDPVLSRKFHVGVDNEKYLGLRYVLQLVVWIHLWSSWSSSLRAMYYNPTFRSNGCKGKLANWVWCAFIHAWFFVQIFCSVLVGLMADNVIHLVADDMQGGVVLNLVKDFMAVLVLADLDELAMGPMLRLVSSLSRTEKDIEHFTEEKLAQVAIGTGLCFGPAGWEDIWFLLVLFWRVFDICGREAHRHAAFAYGRFAYVASHNYYFRWMVVPIIAILIILPIVWITRASSLLKAKEHNCLKQDSHISTCSENGPDDGSTEVAQATKSLQAYDLEWGVDHIPDDATPQQDTVERCSHSEKGSFDDISAFPFERCFSG